MATGKKSSKKKSSAYRLINEETGHHYVVRLGRTGYDKLKDKVIQRFNPVKRIHLGYKLIKLK